MHPKSNIPLQHFDYRPISITPVLSGVLECIVVKDFIYPSLQTPPPGLSFHDQFAFQPTGSTAVALIKLLCSITYLIATHPYVIVYALDFSKAFDSVRHSAVLNKFCRMNLPDNVYNWIENFFREHSHCTRFGGEVSQFKLILASIIQGSWYWTRFLRCDSIGPASD